MLALSLSICLGLGKRELSRPLHAGVQHVVFSFCIARERERANARERAYKSESNMLQTAQNLNSFSFSKLTLEQYEQLLLPPSLPPHSIVAIHKKCGAADK